MKNFPKVKLIDIIKSINWHDIAYVSVVQLLLRFGFINIFNFKTLLTNSLFFILFSSILLITFSGYLINYYYKFKQFKILFLSISSLLIGLTLATYVSYKVQKLENSFIFLGFASVIILVSINLVNRSFVKTIAISMLMAFSLLINWWFNEPISIEHNQWKLFLKLEVIVIVFSLLLFVGNFAREMIFSLKNIDIDKKNGKETFPNVFGVEKTKEIIFLITMITNVIIFASVYFYATKLISYLVILPAHFIPQYFLLSNLKKAKTQKDYKNVLFQLDLMLFTSMIFIPIIAFLIKNFAN